MIIIKISKAGQVPDNRRVDLTLIGPIHSKLGDFVKLVVLFLTVWLFMA